MKIKQQKAFTLIELMVVVAIIAILASMGVANFSTAIIKARNSVRMNDVVQLSKSMETCYDIMSASYHKDATSGLPAVNTSISQNGSVPGTDSLFSAQYNRCLAADIIPTVNNKDYAISVKDYNGVQKYVVCAELENVGGVEELGNVKGTLDGGNSAIEGFNNYLVSDPVAPDWEACTLHNPDDDCMFCIAAQQ